MGSRSRRRSESEDDRTIFAKGLCYSTTEETLVETFGAVSARIPLNNQGRSKGFAYIEFEDEDKAEDALNQHEGIEIDGWVPVLDFVGRKRKNYDDSADRGGGGASRRRDAGRRDGGRRRYGGSYGFQSGGGGGGGSRGGGRGSGQDNSQNRTVYVKNIAPDADEDSLMDLLGCSSVRIPRYRDSDEIKGFAYADFEDHASAQSAIDSLNGEDGLFLEFARERGGGGGGGSGGGGSGGGGGSSRSDNLSEKTLYVKGISYDTDEDSLADLLGSIEVRIPRDRDTDENKGFAYADFRDSASAQKAIDTHSGVDGLTLEFARERGGGGGRGRRGGYRGGRRGYRSGYNGY